MVELFGDGHGEREGGRERERERPQRVYISILSLINTKLIPPMFGYINYILRISSWGEWFLVAAHLRSTPCRCTFRSSKDPAVSVPGKLSSGLIGQGGSIPVLQPFIYLPMNIDMENPQFHTTSRLVLLGDVCMYPCWFTSIYYYLLKGTDNNGSWCFYLLDDSPIVQCASLNLPRMPSWLVVSNISIFHEI